MIFYLIMSGIVLYCVKLKYNHYRLGKIIKAIQIRTDMLSKLIEMCDDPTISDKDFKEILPLCELADEQMDKVMKMPECKNFPAIYELQRLAEIVRQEIED